MKKSVVLLISLVYIISIVVVGILGLQMRVYDEVIYVTDINCIIKNHEKDIKENVQYENVNYDYYCYIPFEENLQLEIQSNVIPDNATNGHVDYSIEGSSSENVQLTKYEDHNLAILTFLEGGDGALTVHVKSTDGKQCEKMILLYVINEISLEGDKE